MSENSAGKQRGRPFQPGQSGNPAGKPKGARHKTTLLAEKLMADDAEGVVNAVLTAAKSGDMAAARIVLDRLYPARRDSPVRFSLPAIDTATDAAQAMAAILAAVAEGDLTPAEAVEIAKLVEVHVRTLETVEFEQRLAALEAKQK